MLVQITFRKGFLISLNELGALGMLDDFLFIGRGKILRKSSRWICKFPRFYLSVPGDFRKEAWESVRNQQSLNGTNLAKVSIRLEESLRSSQNKYRRSKTS
jgi:hypothetical protein